MICPTGTVNGERVLFLLEFQRKVERLMALRTTTYSALTLEGIAAGPDYSPGVRLSTGWPGICLSHTYKSSGCKV